MGPVRVAVALGYGRYVGEDREWNGTAGAVTYTQGQQGPPG